MPQAARRVNCRAPALYPSAAPHDEDEEGLTRGNCMIRTIAVTAFAASLLAAAAAGAENAASKPEPVPAKECVADSSGFKLANGRPTYEVTLENKCEQRLRCTVKLYVTTAAGPSHGRATLTLAPHAAGEAARKSYVLKVKDMGGMAQGSRDCQAF
jgi:hypothetical protein